MLTSWVSVRSLTLAQLIKLVLSFLLKSRYLKTVHLHLLRKLHLFAVLLKKAAGIESGSGEPNRNKVATVKRDKVREIAETKMPDLNVASVESAMRMVEGTARSMGIVVED